MCECVNPGARLLEIREAFVVLDYFRIPSRNLAVRGRHIFPSTFLLGKTLEDLAGLAEYGQLFVSLCKCFDIG